MRIWPAFRALALAGGALICASVIIAQSPGAVLVKVNGTTLLSRTLRNKLVKVSLRTEEIPNQPRSVHTEATAAAARWACTGARVPCLLTLDLKLSLDGSPIHVPREILVDLGDPVDIGIAEHNGDIVLTVTGGDASEAYKLVATVHGGRITGYDFFSLLDESTPLFTVRYPPQPVMN